MVKLNVNTFKTLSFNELGLWLIIPLASLTSHTWLPLPPTLILFLGAIACWFLQQFYGEKKRKVTLNEVSKNIQVTSTHGIALFSLFAFYLFASQYLMNAPFRHYLGAVLAPLYLVFILLFFKNTSSDFLKDMGTKFIRYTIVIFCAEALLRYGYNTWLLLQNANPKVGIYLFKFNGPVYVTSNAVAAHLVTLLFFVLWWSRTYGQAMKKELIITTALIALTFSRVSIPAILLGLAYYYFFRNLNWKKALLFLLSFATLAGLSIWVLKSSFVDYSFQSKFIIINEALEYLRTANLKSILFGIGFDESTQIMTYHAHNYFLLFLLESGVVGLFLLLTTLVFFIKTTNGKAMIVLFPFLIQTSTESNTFLPYFYVAMALMLVYQYRNVMSVPQNSLEN